MCCSIFFFFALQFIDLPTDSSSFVNGFLLWSVHPYNNFQFIPLCSFQTGFAHPPDYHVVTHPRATYVLQNMQQYLEVLLCTIQYSSATFRCIVHLPFAEWAFNHFLQSCWHTRSMVTDKLFLWVLKFRTNISTENTLFAILMLP